MYNIFGRGYDADGIDGVPTIVDVITPCPFALINQFTLQNIEILILSPLTHEGGVPVTVKFDIFVG
jgi:hypothetical protein